MYIKRIIIDNFQSHEHTELDLPPGLTIIVGESDRGKSAIIRALRWVFENEPSGTDFIRAGARKCRVAVETDEGITVIRERTPSRNRYIVRAADGTEESFEGFRNEIPAEVIAAHGVIKAQLDTDLEVSLNIAPQLDGPFLLSAPGSLKAKAIGRLYKVHLIDAAIRDITQDINKLTKEEAGLDDRLSKLESQLEEFNDLPQIEKVLKKGKFLMEKVHQLTERKKNIAQIQTRLKEIGKESSYYKKIKEKLFQLDRGVILYESIKQQENNKQNLSDINTRLKSTRDKLATVQALLSATKDIEGCYPQYDCLTFTNNKRADLLNIKMKLNLIKRDKQVQSKTEQNTIRVHEGIRQQQLLADIIYVYGRLDSLKDKLSALRSKQKNYRLIAEQTEKIDLAIIQRELISKLEQKYAILTNSKNILASLRQTMAPEEIIISQTNQLPDALKKYDTLTEQPQKLEEMRRFTKQHQKLIERINNGRTYLVEKQQEIESTTNKYGALLKKLGQCPTCFSKIDQTTIENIVSELKGKGESY